MRSFQATDARRITVLTDSCFIIDYYYYFKTNARADRSLTVVVDDGVAGGLVSDSEHVLALVSLTNVHDLDDVLQREHLDVLEMKKGWSWCCFGQRKYVAVTSGKQMRFCFTETMVTRDVRLDVRTRATTMQCASWANACKVLDKNNLILAKENSWADARLTKHTLVRPSRKYFWFNFDCYEKNILVPRSFPTIRITINLKARHKILFEATNKSDIFKHNPRLTPIHLLRKHRITKKYPSFSIKLKVGFVHGRKTFVDAWKVYRRPEQKIWRFSQTETQLERVYEFQFPKSA